MANENTGAGPTTQEMTTEQTAMLAKLAKVMPDAKVFEPKPDGKYYGEAVVLTKDFLVQQVGDNTVVAHPRKQMSEWPFDTASARASQKFLGTVLDVNYDGTKATPAIGEADRWLERKSRQPANEINTAVARSHLGPKVGVYDVPPAQLRLSTRYEGVVVAVNGDSVIQRINSRTAIVHNVGAEEAKKLGAGQQIAVQYKDGALSKVAEIEHAQSIEQIKARNRAEPQQGHADGKSLDPEAARKNSFFFARGIVRNGYGQDAKIYDAAKVDPEGKVRGAVVAVADHHVMQRVGAKSFIAHDRSALDGEIKRGALVEVMYENNRGLVTEQPRRRDRQQGQEQAAPRRSQGVER